MSDDPTAPGVFARQPAPLQSRDGRLDPFDWYREMRADHPVSYDEDRRAWDVFRYEDVTRVLSEHETFSSGAMADHGGRRPGPNPLSATMINADPPAHDRLRGFVDEQFRPGVVRERRPYVEDLAESLLADADDARDGDVLDLVPAFAFPLPVVVVADLLDVPADRRDEFKRWSDALVAAPEEQTESELLANQRERMESVTAMASFFQETLSARRGGDGDDLVTLAANAEDLTPTERLGFCILLLVAGNVTTTNLVTNAVWTFDEQGLTADVASGAIEREDAIEEALRFRSPVQAMSRVTTGATEVGGVEIPAGERVTAWIGSANRDEAVFDEPDAFVPGRSPNRHVAFGTGVHYCLGAPLARLEADVALAALFDRYDHVEVTDDPLQPVSSPIVYGLESLPLRVA